MYKRHFHGFTLVELMITVGIVGILASIAIPAFNTYLLKARSAEVPNTFNGIFKAATTYYATEFVQDIGVGQLGADLVHGCAVSGNGMAGIPNTLALPPGEKAFGDFGSNSDLRAMGFTDSGMYSYAYMVFGTTKCRSSYGADLNMYQVLAIGVLSGTKWHVGQMEARAVSDSLVRSPGISWQMMTPPPMP